MVPDFILGCHLHSSATNQSGEDLISNQKMFTVLNSLVCVLIPLKFLIRESNAINSDEGFNVTFTV